MLKRLYILTLLVFAVVLPGFAQNSKIERQKKVVAQLEKRIAQEEKQLETLRKNKASVEQQLESLTRQIEERNKLIKETTEQIEQLTEEVEASEQRLIQLGGQLDELEKNAGDIVRSAYRNYRYSNNLTYLFSAKSFRDLAQRISTLRVATYYRCNQIAEVSAARSDVQAEREILTKRKNELSETKKRLDRQRSKLEANVKEAKRQISKMSDKQKEVLRAKIANEEKLKEAVKQLRKLVKGNKKGASIAHKLTMLDLPVVGGTVKQYKGNLAVIIGKKGAAVNSVYEGKVVEITRNKINNMYNVFIAHGEYLTSYADLSEVVVSKDAVVKKGERIGTIGSALNTITMKMEDRIVFGIYAPNPDVVISAESCFK